MMNTTAKADGTPELRVEVKTNPSLALVKYWGKRRLGYNLPATTSVAVSLGGLATTSRISIVGTEETDRVELDGVVQPPDRFRSFFAGARSMHDSPDLVFNASSSNNFPSSSGLASSSSGFAALALGCHALAEANRRAAFDGDAGGFLPLTEANRKLASESARHGSVSASRAVYGGFTALPAGAIHARRVFPASHWPEFRVLVVITSKLPKEASSRGAMEATRLSSPYYSSWVKDSRLLAREALLALGERDMEKLGATLRLSYSRMHASALASDPPLLYWLPASVAVIRACAALRSKGIGAWETMDAGPQVKIICISAEIDAIKAFVEAAVPGLSFVEAYPASDPQVRAIRGEGR